MKIKFKITKKFQKAPNKEKEHNWTEISITEGKLSNEYIKTNDT